MLLILSEDIYFLGAYVSNARWYTFGVRRRLGVFKKNSIWLRNYVSAVIPIVIMGME